eukprot:464869_1
MDQDLDVQLMGQCCARRTDRSIIEMRSREVKVLTAALMILNWNSNSASDSDSVISEEGQEAQYIQDMNRKIMSRLQPKNPESSNSVYEYIVSLPLKQQCDMARLGKEILDDDTVFDGYLKDTCHININLIKYDVEFILDNWTMIHIPECVREIIITKTVLKEPCLKRNKIDFCDAMANFEFHLVHLELIKENFEMNLLLPTDERYQLINRIWQQQLPCPQVHL